MMNKYIKTDIEQAFILLKAAIMNALSDLETGVEKEIRFEVSLPLQLIIKCAEERGWEEDPDMDCDWTNGWEVDYFYYMITPNKQYVGIYGSLLESTHTRIVVNHDDEI